MKMNFYIFSLEKGGIVMSSVMALGDFVYKVFHVVQLEYKILVY